MAWDLIQWLLFFLMTIALLGLNLFQIICLQDLENDYLNPFESSSRINVVVVPEFILQGAFSAILLLTWHWFIFLITVPINYYNIMLYIERKHLIDVTEVFRILKVEKKIRIFKLVFYLLLFSTVILRLVMSVFNSLVDEEDAVHIF